KFQLAPERHKLSSILLQGHSKKIAKPRDHLPRQPRLGFYQRPDRVQSIKKKMWVQLHLQSLKLGLHKLFFKARGIELLGLPPAIKIESTRNPDNRPIDQQIDVKIKKPCKKVVLQRLRHILAQLYLIPQKSLRNRLHQNQHHAGQQVNW